MIAVLVAPVKFWLCLDGLTQGPDAGCGGCLLVRAASLYLRVAVPELRLRGISSLPGHD